MTPEQLKKSIYRIACSGKLTSRTNVNDAFSYCKNVLKIQDKDIFTNDSNALIEVPQEWVFVKLKDLCEMSMGQTVLKTEMDESGDPIYSATIDDIPLGYIKHSRNKICLTKGDFVIPARGNSIGFITRIYDECASGTQTTICAKLVDKEISEYLYYYLMAFKDTLFAYNGAAIPQITISKISSILIPIPSKEEQRNIVTKIEELLPLVDRYEDAWNKLEKFNKKFPRDMEKSLLNYALKGKLVEQNYNEGSGEQLFNKINKTKNDLINNKIIKKIRKTVPLTENDYPFDIPSNWKWCRFGDLVDYRMGKTPPRSESEWWKDEIPWISIADMPENGHILTTKEKVSRSAIVQKFNNVLSPSGTLVMSFKLTVGRVSILDIDAVHNEAIISIFPFVDHDCVFRDYLFYILPFISQYGNSKKAIKGNTLNDSSICNLPIPLPPLEEQKRIVSKLEELLPLCRKLVQ